MIDSPLPTTTTTLPELDPVPSLTVPDLTESSLPTRTTVERAVPTTDAPASGSGGTGIGLDLQVVLLIAGFLVAAAVLAAFTVRYWQRTRPA